MHRALALVALLATLTVPTPAGAGGGGIVVDPVVTNLGAPAAFAFAPGGRIFFGELSTGTIYIYDPATTGLTRFVSIPNLISDGENGLLGVAMHPEYPAKPYVFAYATQEVGGDRRNRILRFRDEGGEAIRTKLIFESNVEAAHLHSGGRILFGPDGKLYVVIGDALAPANAQRRQAHAGKILRMNPNGTIPSDNPYPDSYVYAYGIRNSFGFAFDPQTARMWETDNGPDCNDELNRIKPGGNYGWGPEGGCSSSPPPPMNTNEDGPRPRLPKRWFTPTIAPTGIAFCEGCGLPGSEGDLFFMGYNDGRIYRATLTDNRRDVASLDVAVDTGRFLLSLERGPGGTLFFSDFEGIYRLIPG